MSRVGKLAVEIPSGVDFSFDSNVFTLKSSKGEVKVPLSEGIDYKKEDNLVSFAPKGNSRELRANWGLVRSLFANAVDGVANGVVKELEIQGVGYRAAIKSGFLVLNLGYSHDIYYDIPEDIDIKCPTQTQIVISGVDKQKVGQVAAEIRSYRKPEPYKGKGIRYKGEIIIMKEGKKK